MSDFQLPKINIKKPNYDKIGTLNVNNSNSTIEVVELNTLEAETVSNAITTSTSSNKSSFSDKAAIMINRIGKLTAELAAYFGNDTNLWNNYLSFITGQKLSDFLDKEGKLKLLDEDSIKKLNLDISKDDINKINNILNKYNENGSLGLSSEFLNFKIEEVVYKESGYDAVVLQKEDGGYVICSAHTDAKSYGDINTIAYTLINYLFDESLANYIFPIITSSVDGLSNNFLSVSSDSSNKYYRNQINDCEELIKKYSKKAESTYLELSGYSLGGGVLSTAYASLQNKNPNILDNVKSITVYNPFLLIADSYEETHSLFNFEFNFDILKDDIFNSDLVNAIKDSINNIKNSENEEQFWGNFVSSSANIIKHAMTTNLSEEALKSILNCITFSRNSEENLINILKNDDKYTIYNAEYDIVSTLNNYLTELDDKIIYLMTNIQSEGTYETVVDNSILNLLRDPLEAIEFNIGNLFEFIIKSDGTHSIGSIDIENNFDEHGNLIQSGEYQNINEIFATLTGDNEYTASNSQSPDLSYILSTLLENALYSNEISLGADAFDVDISPLIDYISKNTGNFDEEEFLDIADDILNEFLISDIGKNLLKDIVLSIEKTNDDEILAELEKNKDKLTDTIYKDLEKKVEEEESDFTKMLLSIIENENVYKTFINSVTKLLKDKKNYKNTLEILYLITNGNDKNLALKILLEDIVQDNIIDLKDDLIPPLTNFICDYLQSDEGQKLLKENLNSSILSWLISRDRIVDTILDTFYDHDEVAKGCIQAMVDGKNVIDYYLENYMDIILLEAGKNLHPFEWVDDIMEDGF